MHMSRRICLIFVIAINTCCGQINKIDIKKIKVPSPYFKIYYADSIPKIIEGKPYTGMDTSTFMLGQEKLTAIETFQDGFKIEVKTFYDNNKPECQFQFKNGKREGISRSWYKSGKVLFDYQMKEGKDVGITMMFHESGNPSYIRDQVNGLTMEFYENGKLKHRTRRIIDSALCSDGKGLEEISWYEDGQLREKGIMNCGRQSYKIYANDTTVLSESIIIGIPLFKVGKYHEYFKNGKSKVEGQFKDSDSQRESNIMIGTWKYYNEKGQVIKEEYYEDNKLIKTKEYIKEKKATRIKG
jgi:antitoxin component YwqK of YwqJK toxin-antitoxin module